MLLTRTEINVHIEYDPNEPQNPAMDHAATVIVETLKKLKFQQALERELKSKLSPEEFQLIEITVKTNY